MKKTLRAMGNLYLTLVAMNVIFLRFIFESLRRNLWSRSVHLIICSDYSKYSRLFYSLWKLKRKLFYLPVCRRWFLYFKAVAILDRLADDLVQVTNKEEGKRENTLSLPPLPHASPFPR